MSSLTERNPNLNEPAGSGPPATDLASEDASASKKSAATPAEVPANNAFEAGDTPLATENAGAARITNRPPGKRWLLLAAGSAILLSLLTIAGIYVITKNPSTVDNLVILTVPSGAEIKLGEKYYGQSPVKIEQVEKGTYLVTITKDNYETIVREITVSKSEPLEFKLRPLPPADSMGLSPEETIKFFQQRADDAFSRGRYGIPSEDSALYYTDLILGFDPSNQFAIEMRERIRKTMHLLGKTAESKGHLGQAQEVYALLVEYYPDDAEARASASRLESRLSSRRGELRGLALKAEEALRVNDLIEPEGASAYHYAKEALAIDRQNSQARAVRDKVKERLTNAIDQAVARGDVDAAIKQLEKITQFFPEDRKLQARLRDLSSHRTAEITKSNDPKSRRVDGLKKYRHEDFIGAIPDLEFALSNGEGTTDVIFALARSYLKLNQYDQAAYYFRKVPQVGDEAYRSSIAALGDIAIERGDTATALDRYKEARQLGGSVLYSIAILDDKIEKIEKRQRQKAAEPVPLTIQVRHSHGGVFGGSCRGTLTVNSTGVRYDGSEADDFSANLVGVSVRISRDEMVLQFQNKTEKFKITPANAERFRETLARYQAFVSSGNQ